MKHISSQVEAWEEQVLLPTYGVGEADKNPMFLEKRVYQGSSGKVYPYPIIDKICDQKVEKPYRAVFLENDYLRVMILPELGGRIQRAYDKTNGYDFVYHNEVIKPALVGLLGPWVSGGIEFNWPQHHRPTTFSPVDCTIRENSDGSRTVLLSEVDQMYGTKGMAQFTLYPDRAYIEIRGQLYNRTNVPQTFLWWANPAVPANDDTQSIFPPDVYAVMDHGKRDVSRFPIATGIYYKHDYRAGVDISRFRNIPVPTSYMAYHSDYDFVGAYDHGRQAGILHVADHRVSPGKKQWTWGCGDFGKAWDRNLTDRDGPYIELMTGVYTDNQPDFSWLMPFEEKTFTQYFMPYKKAGNVKNASTEAALNLEVRGGEADVCVYATARYEGARVVLAGREKTYLDRTCTLSPVEVLQETVPVGEPETALTLSVYDSAGRPMLSYTPREKGIEKLPEPARPAGDPEKIATCEKLYLTGLHIEQYRHATYEPDPYYLEGLRRDPGDIRLNTAYGLLLLRRGLFREAEGNFRRAVERLTWKNPNPYDGEPYFDLGLALLYQGREDEAFDAFYKATWTDAQQEAAFYYLAALAARKGSWREALSFADRSLVKNGHNLKARGLRATLLRRLGDADGARACLEENLRLDPFDYRSRLELCDLEGNGTETALAMMGGRASSFIECAIDYAEAGFYAEAVAALRLCGAGTPMLRYYEAYCDVKLGDGAAARAALKEAAGRDPRWCFPNRLEDLLVLEAACAANPADSKAPYYLGNLYYDKRQWGRARELWERAAALDKSYPTVWRNLALAYYNKEKEPGKALDAMERAYSLDPSDARVFLELDQLRKKTGMPPERRMEAYESHREVFAARDDLYTEYVTLLNLLGRHEEAYQCIMERKFHPWEGGEGKVTTQYAVALVQLAKKALMDGDAGRAKELLERALVFPENLGEGKLEGEKDNDIYYWLGIAEEKLGNPEAAEARFGRAALGEEEPKGMMFYNDQPADRILYQGLARRRLGREAEARARFHALIDYGEKHLFDEVKIDYFAVSLPDLQLFDEDLGRRNQAHCHYLIGLGSYGLGDAARAEESYRKVLEIDSAHLGAVIHRRMLEERPL